MFSRSPICSAVVQIVYPYSNMLAVVQYVSRSPNCMSKKGSDDMSTAAWMNERIVKENKLFPPAEQSPHRVCGKTQKVSSRYGCLYVLIRWIGCFRGASSRRRPRCPARDRSAESDMGQRRFRSPGESPNRTRSYLALHS